MIVTVGFTSLEFGNKATVMTQGVANLLETNIGANLHIYLMRHQNGDWGDMSIEDKITNDESTKSDGRIMSSYKFCGEKIWIITEWNRSVTTVLLPSEY
ncbi:type I restriction endonuclease subunit M [Vibrio sp. ER1A]|nr:type I restriction endonuclease subunit M [Vibrio sp. ER1A]